MIMASDTIVNPEVGRVYLVRRKINGALTKRFEPALIKARFWHEGSMDTFAGWRLNLRWVYDRVEDLGVLEVEGHVKDMPKRWVAQEIERASAELSAATKKYDSLLALKLTVEHRERWAETATAD